MVEFARRSIAEDLATPRIAAPGLAVTCLDPAWQLLVSGPAALGSALGVALPEAPNTVAGTQPYAIWFAPRRWLVVADGPAAPAPLAAVEAAGGFASEIGDGHAVIELAGPASLDVIAMACVLEPGDIVPGRSARTLVFGLKAVLYAHGAADRFRIHVARPVAAHFMDFLAQAAGALG